jgi:hypothetical protein
LEEQHQLEELLPQDLHNKPPQNKKRKKLKLQKLKKKKLILALEDFLEMMTFDKQYFYTSKT